MMGCNSNFKLETNPGLDQIHQERLDNASKSYLFTSPTVRFGHTGEALLKKLLEVHGEFSSLLHHTNNPTYYLGAGWNALELATITDGLEASSRFMKQSLQYFKRVSNSESMNNEDNPTARYLAQMGILAHNAYTTDEETARYDTPGMYTEILEQLLSDETLRKRALHLYSGLLAELVCSTSISSLGHLALPASVRHDRSRTRETPSLHHDIQVWFKGNGFKGEDATRLAQVKLSEKYLKPGQYSNSIALLIISRMFTYRLKDIADSFIRFYNAEDTHDDIDIIETSQKEVMEHISVLPDNDA